MAAATIAPECTGEAQAFDRHARPFVTSKTVDVKKSHVGLTIIRDSTIRHESFTERAPKLGGLVEFYRSPDRVLWTPTGINVPDYPKLNASEWLGKEDGPAAKLENEKPQGETIAYDELIKGWTEKQ